MYEDLDKPHEAMKDFNRVLEMDKSHAEANKAAMVSVTNEELLNGVSESDESASKLQHSLLED